MRSVMIFDNRSVMVEAIPGTDKFAVLTHTNLKLGEIEGKELHDPHETHRALRQVCAAHEANEATP